MVDLAQNKVKLNEDTAKLQNVGPDGYVIPNEFEEEAAADGVKSAHKTVTTKDYTNQQDGSDVENDGTFSSSDWRVRLNSWLSVLVRFVLVAGFLVTGWQYWESIQRNREVRSYELVTFWETKEMQKAQFSLFKTMSTTRTEIEALVGVPNTPEEYASIQYLVSEEVFRQAYGKNLNYELRENFDKVLYFLNRISYCSQDKICDVTVMKNFFGEYIQSFLNNFGEKLQKEKGINVHNLYDFVEAQT